MSARISTQQIAELNEAAKVILPKSVSVSFVLAVVFVVMALINMMLAIALVTRVVTPVAVSDNGTAIELKPLNLDRMTSSAGRAGP